MKNSLLKRAGIIVLRTIGLFITFGLITIISRFIFVSNLFEKEMLTTKFIGIWGCVFLFLIFESTVYSFNRHAVNSQHLFLERYAKGQQLGKLKSVFSSLDFYIEYFVIALLSLIFPLSFVYDYVGLALFKPGYSKTQIMLVVLPILLVIEILVHLYIRNAWISENVQVKRNKKEKSEFAWILKGIGTTAIVYCAASLVIPWGIPFFITLTNLGAGTRVLVYIVIALLSVIIFRIAALYVRAIKKRKDFFSKLKKYCGEHSIALSNIQKPYLSVFFQQKGTDFTLECNNILYDCKLVAGVFPNSSIIFSDEGEGIRQNMLRLFKVDILQLNTRIDYRMESRSESSKKIIIALPVPQNIYASVQGSFPRPADTGEKMGEYTLYTATGFLNALERNHLSVNATA